MKKIDKSVKALAERMNKIRQSGAEKPKTENKSEFDKTLGAILKVPKPKKGEQN